MGELYIMPPGPGNCINCGVKHDPMQPHDATTFFYRASFSMIHNRAATWVDAMAHCEPDVQEQWKQYLTAIGIAYGLKPQIPYMLDSLISRKQPAAIVHAIYFALSSFSSLIFGESLLVPSLDLMDLIEPIEILLSETTTSRQEDEY